MELREILNRAEGIVINAKSFNAGVDMTQVQTQLLNLKALLNKELQSKVNFKVNFAEPSQIKQPAADETIAVPAFRLVKRAEQAAEQQAAEPESKPDSGVVSEPGKAESKPDSGVVSKPEKSQNRDGSGVS